jgi:hypothetical protein
MNKIDGNPNTPFRKYIGPGIACVLLGAAAVYTFFAYRTRLQGAGPLLLLLMCPLMHIFAHKGHGGHGAHRGGGGRGSSPKTGTRCH